MPKQNGANGEHVVTMREVAKAAGVSIKTVSNVVNDYEFVSQATRDKVNKAIDELGYTLNVSARNLRRGQTGIIGLAIPDLQMPYFAQLSSLVIEEAKKMGNGIGIIDKNPTINLVKSKGVKLMPLTKLVEVTKKGAKVQNVETGEEQLIECDTVLTSLGVEQNTKLYDEIAKAFPNAKLIGDATTPAGKVYRTLEAVKGGYQASMAL